jgi:hypothetical protein
MIPLVTTAGWLLYTLLLTIGTVIRGAEESEVLSGQLFCIAGILVLGLPGLIGLLASRSVRIDPVACLVSEVQDFRLFQTTNCTGLADIDYIALTCEREERDADRSYPRMLTYYNVNLVRKRERGAIEVAMLRSHAEAAALAHALSTVLQLALQDLSDTEPEAL